MPHFICKTCNIKYLLAYVRVCWPQHIKNYKCYGRHSLTGLPTLASSPPTTPPFGAVGGKGNYGLGAPRLGG